MIKKEQKYDTTWSAIGLAWQLGYTIAIPIVALALGGRFLDKYLGTSPAFLLSGIFVSTLVSSWLVYRRVAKLLY